MPSRGSGFETAVARTTLSPMRTTAAPWACFAKFPVSNEIRLPPVSSTRYFLFHSLSFLAGGMTMCDCGGCTTAGRY